MNEDQIEQLYQEYVLVANQKDLEQEWMNSFGDPSYYNMNDYDDTDAVAYGMM